MTKKGTTKKKATAKKTKKKSTPRDSSEKDQLLRKLHEMTEVMNEEDLTTLVNNARIILHNRRVVEEVSRASEVQQKRPEEQAPSGEDGVSISEADDGSYFIFTIRGYRNFFALNEMRKAVKICHASRDEADAASRLFKWFSNERLDVVRNSYISGSQDPTLSELYRTIVNTYTVKGQE